MTARAAGRRLGRLLAEVAGAAAERRGPAVYRGTVLRVRPLRVDLHGVADLELDADDVRLGKSIDPEVLAVGDVLVLNEVSDHDFVAVDVETEEA